MPNNETTLEQRMDATISAYQQELRAAAALIRQNDEAQPENAVREEQAQWQEYQREMRERIRRALYISPVPQPKQQRKRYKATIQNELYPWRYAAGVELTFMPVSWECTYKEDEGTTQRKKIKLHKLKNEFEDLGDICKPQVDDHCVELPTKIISNWKDAENIYKAVRARADSLKLVPLLNNVCSGGGHIHISIGKNEWSEWCNSERWDHSTFYAFQKQIFPEIANRPWLGWIFNDPVDEDFSLRHYYTQGKVEHTKCRVASICVSKGLEFRFFAAANDWSEQEEHLAFAQAFFHRLWSRRDKKPVKLLYEGESWPKFKRYFTYSRCCEEFEQFVKKLGLPWRRYKHYTSEYLVARFENEKWLI